MLLRFAIVLLLFSLSTALLAEPVVGICQRKDILAKEAKDKAQKDKEKEAQDWQKVRNEVRAALKKRAAAKTKEERDKYPIPDTSKTLLFRIEVAREKVETEYFAAKRKSKVLRSQLSMTEHHLREARLAVSMANYDMEDLGQAFDFTRLTQLGIEAATPAFVYPDTLASLIAEKRKSVTDLKKEASVHAEEVKKARAKCSEAFSYVRLRAGLYGEPDFAKAKNELGQELSKSKREYSEAYGKAQAAKNACLQSMAALKETTAPTAQMKSKIEEQKNNIRTLVKKVQDLHFAKALKEKELQELEAQQHLWNVEKASYSKAIEFKKLAGEIKELEGVHKLSLQFQDSRDSLDNYKVEVASLETKAKELQKSLAEAKSEEKKKAEKLKRFIDHELREKEAIERAERKGDGSFFNLAMKAISGGVKWLWERFREIPAVVSAMAYMNRATPGYFLELLKQMLMFAVGVVSDVVFLAAPALGMAVGFLISQLDSWISSPIVAKKPNNPAIVLNVSQEASKYYFLSTDGKSNASTKVVEMVSQYKKFLAKARQGYDSALRKERQRAKKMDELCRQYTMLSEALTTQRQEYKGVIKDYNGQRKIIAECEKILLPFRQAQKKAQQSRSILYGLRKELDEAQSVQQFKLIEERAAAEKASVESSLRQMRNLSSQQGFQDAGTKKNQALQQMERLKQEAAQLISAMVEKTDNLQNLGADIDTLKSVSGKGKAPALSRPALNEGLTLLLPKNKEPLKPVKPLPGVGEGKPLGTAIKWGGDWGNWYQGELKKAGITALLEPFLPAADEAATQAKQLLSLKAKGRRIVDNIISAATDEFNDKLLPLASAPLAIASETTLLPGVAFVDVASDVFGKKAEAYNEVRKMTWKYVESAAKFEIPAKLQTAEATMAALEKAAKELDMEMTLFQKLGGLTGPKEQVDEVLTKIRSLVSQIDDGAKQMSDDLGSLFKAFNSSVDEIVQNVAPSARAQTKEVMERVLKETFGEAIEEASGSQLLGRMNKSLMDYFKKNAFTGNAKSLGRLTSLIKPIVNGPAVLLRKMAKSEFSAVSAFAKGAQENITGLYINILYLMKDLYGLIDVEDPCFPDQPLLKHEKETQKPSTQVVDIPVPAGDTWRGWIEVHDVTSGISPKSFQLEVQDVTKGTKGAYAKATDIFANDTAAWKSLGENPLNEKKRGKGITVLQEVAYKTHASFKWPTLVARFVNPLLLLAGSATYEGEIADPLYLENKIKRVRFNFDLDLKDSLGHTFRLSPKVYDRSGRPSSIGRRDYFVRFVRDVHHPQILIKTPKDGHSVEASQPLAIEFSVDDVTAAKKDGVSEHGVSGVSPNEVVLTILRHGKAIYQETMATKKAVAGKLFKGRYGKLIKDPVLYSLKKELPEGEYELRLSARDRAGNKTVNGVAQVEKVKTKPIRFVVGNPKDVLLQATIDPYRPSYGPGTEAEISLRLVNKLPQSVKEVTLQLPQTNWKKHIEIKDGDSWAKGKSLKVRDNRPGSSFELLEKVLFKVPQKDIKQGALIELPFAASVLVEGASKPVEANFVVHIELKGRLAAQDIFFEGRIHFTDARDESHPLPYGTKVGITHIYEMPLAGLGASGLQSGGKKFVEQFVGFGEIDNNTGHLLCRVRPVGGGRKDRFRAVAHSFAVTPKKGGGKQGIASVVGLRRKLPFKIVSQPFSPDRDTLKASAGGVRFLRPKSAIIIPGPKSDNHPVELKHEGCLTTGGHINPWGDMGGGGGAAFAMSMTLAGQMANMATMGKPSGGDTIPGLMWRNHTDAFAALSQLVKAYRFTSNLSRLTVPEQLKKEFGEDFIPLLAGDTEASVGPYGQTDEDDEDDEAHSETHSSATKRSKALELLQSLKKNTLGNEKLARMVDSLLALVDEIEKSKAVIEETTKEKLIAKGRREQANLRLKEIEFLRPILQAAVVSIDEQKELSDTPSAAAQVSAQRNEMESLLSALKKEETWLNGQITLHQQIEDKAAEKDANARNRYSAQRTRYLELKTQIAGVTFDQGLDPSVLAGLSPVERFDEFANYVPKEEKENKSRQQVIDVYLAQLKKERLRRQLKTEALPVKGQTARWWPAGPNEDERQVTLYRPDFEGNQRVMIPAGSGKDCLNKFRLLRAYGAYVREAFIEKTSHIKKSKRLPRYTLVGPIEGYGTDFAIDQAWDEGFDTFFASAIVGVPTFIDAPSVPTVTYHDHLSRYKPWTTAHKKRSKGRGLDNPTAVATMFWLLYERFGRDFLANVLGYGKRIHLPQLASYYPELNEEFRLLGLLPVLTFEKGKHGLPIVRWHDNGIVKDCRDLDFVVEYSRDRTFHGDIVVVESKDRNVIDFGAALKPEGVNDVLGNRLEDGKYYFRAKLRGPWVGKVFGQAYTATSIFTVSRPKKKIGPAGGTVPFKAGTINGRIEVDEDALPEDVNISVTPLQLPSEIEGYQVVGNSAFELLPEVEYQKAASLVFEYTDEDVAAVNEGDLSLHVYDKKRNRFVPVPAEHDKKNNRIVAKRDGHSIYALLVDTQPPEVTEVKAGPSPFNPRVQVIRFNLLATEPASFQVKLSGKDGLLKELSSAPSNTGKATVLWDGRDKEGNIVADGVYSYIATATDLSGKVSSEVSGKVFVLMGQGGVVKGRVQVINQQDHSSVTVSVLGTTLKKATNTLGEFEIEGVPPGTHEVLAQRAEYFPEIWVDKSVAAGEVTSLPTKELTNTALTDGKILSEYVTPDDDGLHDEFVFSFTADRRITLSAVIKDVTGKVVAKPWVNRTIKAGEHNVVWDCRSFDGVVETNGRHEFSLYASVGSIKLIQARESFVVDEGLARSLFVTPLIISPNNDGLDDITSVIYTVTSTAEVTVEVVDASGSPLRKLVRNEVKEIGDYAVDWLGDDDLGNTIADGTYSVVLSSRYPDGYASKIFTKRVVVDSVVPEIKDLRPLNGTTLTTGMPEIVAQLVASPGDVPPGNVKVKIDEHTVTPDEYSIESGVIKYRPKTSLGKGTHIAIVYARDVAGNEAPPQAVSFKVEFDKKTQDRKGPKVTCVAPTLDGLVYRNDPSFELNVFDEHSGIDKDTIELYIDGERVANSVIEYIPGKSGKAWDMWQYEKMKVLFDPLQGRIRYNSLNELKRKTEIEGTHTWRFVLRDRAGNRSQEHHGRFKLHLDEKPPLAEVLEPKNVETTLKPTVKWLASDEGPSGAAPFNTLVTVDGNLLSGFTALAKYKVNEDLAERAREYRLNNRKLEIESGNKAFEFKARVKEDTQKLVVSLRANDGKLVQTDTRAKYTIENNALKKVVTASCPSKDAQFTLTRGRENVVTDRRDDEEEKKRCHLVLPAVLDSSQELHLEVFDEDGVLLGKVEPSFVVSHELKDELSNGEEHVLALAVFDRAGNKSEVYKKYFVTKKDELRPTIVSLSPKDGQVVRSAPVIKAVFYDDGDAGVASDGVVLTLDGRRLTPVVDVQKGELTRELGSLTEGEHILTLTITDRAGNSTKKATAFYHSNDMNPPRLLAFTPPHGSTVNGSIVRISAVFEDEGSGIDPASIQVSLDGEVIAADKISFDVRTGRLSVNAPIKKQEGDKHLIGLSLRDYGGNPLKERAISVFTAVRGGGAK